MPAPSKRPQVTLRSTCYNHAAFVERSLDSIARQDFGDIQWIIVDDASNDDSPARIRAWLGCHQGALERKGFSIQFLVHATNRGFVSTLNEIVALARGTYICGLSTDDVMLPDRISTAVRLLDGRHGRYAAAYADAYLIDSTGRRIGNYLRGRRPVPAPSGDIYGELLQENFIAAPTVMIRTGALREAGGYDPDLAYEDYDMWLRVAARREFVFCRQPLVEYRLHDHNYHHTIANADAQLYWVYRKHIDRAAGKRRMLRHFAEMTLRGEVTQRIAADFRALQLPPVALVKARLRQLRRHPGKVWRRLLRGRQQQRESAA